MKPQHKIKNLDELAHVIEALKADGQKVIHCHGVFDLLHIGHIRYFTQAKEFGDVLVVTITPDEYVDKGPHRPAFNEQLRAEAIASLDEVDYVAVNKWPTAIETLRLLRPTFYVKGEEFKDLHDATGKIHEEVEVAKALGVTVKFAGDIVFSSTNLINRYLSNLPKDIQRYLQVFRSRYSLEEILKNIERMSQLKVLVIGDSILDEYQYCNAIGKSSKDPVLAVSYQSGDLFLGGSLAVVNHISSFVQSVGLVTILGERDSHEAFISKNLASNVNKFFFYKRNAPTTIKRRIVDGYTFNKLIEIYVMDDSPLPKSLDQACCETMQSLIQGYDLVIAADFGHSAISDRMISILTTKAPYLTVNTQANAGNRGFHTISKYPRADLTCLAEHEIRLDARDLQSNLRALMQPLVQRMQTRHCIITNGRRGCLVSGQAESFVKVPSFATSVIDRVGAGDALFSIASLASYLDIPEEMMGFMGNVAGTLAVQVIGNKRSINKKDLLKSITSLLK